MWFQLRSLQGRSRAPDEFVGHRAGRDQMPLPQMTEDFRSSLTAAVGVLRAWTSSRS